MQAANLLHHLERTVVLLMMHKLKHNVDLKPYNCYINLLLLQEPKQHKNKPSYVHPNNLHANVGYSQCLSGFSPLKTELMAMGMIVHLAFGFFCWILPKIVFCKTAQKTRRGDSQMCSLTEWFTLFKVQIL